MNKNYYDILQVNKNASPEIIEKAYKVLVKKYHPDLQTEENKKQAEEMLKEINEAYEILSDPEKREIYNASFSKEEEPPISNQNTEKEKQQMAYQQQLQQEQQIAYQEQLKRQRELEYQEQLQQAKQKAYYDAYIQDLKNRGYKIRYQKSFKDYIKGFITLLIVLLILFLLWQIPLVQQFFIDFYEQNEILQTVFKEK